jgi:glycosyltransferase involved in cell wall biosynthesis
LTRRKNIELAIAIVAALRRRSDLDIRLLVTGPPGPHNPANEAYLVELLEQCRRLQVPDAIHFLHRVDPQAPRTLDATTVAELFTVADALLFTSRDEGFGIPILEAGLARLPVFCTDIPAFRESGGDEVTYFGLGSSEEQVAELILDSLESDPRYRLRQRVLREYSWWRLVHDCLVPLLEPSGHD